MMMLSAVFFPVGRLEDETSLKEGDRMMKRFAQWLMVTWNAWGNPAIQHVWWTKMQGVIKLPIWGGGGIPIWQFLRDSPSKPLDFLHPKNAMALDLIGKTLTGCFSPLGGFRWGVSFHVDSFESYQKMLLTRWEGSCGSFWFVFRI